MYSDVSAFYYGGISEWRLCGIFSQKDLERFSSTGLDDAKKIVDRCIECNYSILCIDDELFPQPLTQIVIPSVASAPLCDAPSTPNAPPLTIIVHISGTIQILEVQFPKEVLSLQSIRLMKHRGITIFLPETGL